MARSTDPDVRLLAALADPIRLSIARRLAGGEAICACDFTESCDVSQPTVSHHLRVLREAGVVASERRGSWIWYRLAPEAAGRLSAIARALVPGDPVFAGTLATTRRRPSPGAADATALSTS